MGQVLHKRATTTQRIRAEIQRSTATIKELSKAYGINPKTVAKWKARTFVEDAPNRKEAPRSTVLSREEEALCVAFRKHALLPLDDCLYALQDVIPHLGRSSLHRLFQRHGISRLPVPDKPKRQAFKTYDIGYFHVDIAEVRTEEGKLYMFVAIDRTSKVAYVELHDRQTKANAARFLRNLIKTIPYRISIILTDNGSQFTHRADQRYAGQHLFDQVCQQHDIEHRLTQIGHPWTNGQVERMNRTLKEATVRKYHYKTHDQLRNHLQAFVSVYNNAKRLKSLKGLTPHQYICNRWTEKPKLFTVNPIEYHNQAGLYT